MWAPYWAHMTLLNLKNHQDCCRGCDKYEVQIDIFQRYSLDLWGHVLLIHLFFYVHQHNRQYMLHFDVCTIVLLQIEQHNIF